MILDVKNPSKAQVDALIELWKIDAKLDKLEPSRELGRIGSLHSKYLEILSTHRRAYRGVSHTFTKLKRIKYEYYTGKMDQDTLKKYGWAPFPYTLKADISTYMDSDKDILEAKRTLDIHEEIMDLCQSILKELGSRTFALKDIIRWEIFINGGN